MNQLDGMGYEILRTLATTGRQTVYAVSTQLPAGTFLVEYLSRERARKAIASPGSVLLAACEPGGQVFTNN